MSARPALACAGYGDQARFPLYEIVRDACYAVLRGRPAGEVFVMTNALAVGSDREQDAWHLVVELAMARNVPLVPVILTAAHGELLRRIASPDRNPRKLSDPATLSDYVDRLKFQHPAVAETLVLDVTRLDPADAASGIERHLGAVGPQLRPATLAHRLLQ